MMSDDGNPWCKVDVEENETGEFLKVALWCKKAELADGLSKFSD